ncbi:MAG: GTPase HflX [Candidatus Omnitrophota bacterium]
MEKAILVTVDLKEKGGWGLEDRARELRELAFSGGASIEGELLCRREKPTPDLFVGKGKFEELVLLCRAKGADVVIFNNDLTPIQLRNLEKGLGGMKVIDRTQLILDIFAQRAKSVEGKLQVELARLEYALPRLTGRGVQLSRLGGGIGTRGPGEKILEYDRRRIRDRVARLKIKLKDVERRREALRKRRGDALLTTVAIIGYTNAGKTTLLNRLTNSNKLTADKLFSTLDPVARTYVMPNKQKVLFLDTVGFLYDLPHNLVEAFKSTLEEVSMADILLHVLDASNKQVRQQEKAVREVLAELNAKNKIIVNVLNKTDLASEASSIKRLSGDFKDAVAVSALKGEGMENLIEELSCLLSGLITEVKIEIPRDRMDKLSLIYENGKVRYREDRAGSIYVEATVPVRLKDALLS